MAASLAGLVAAPLSLAYGVGRIGRFLSGDGTYGTPSDLPWAMAFPNGTMPSTVPVHPTALYEALVAIASAAVLWGLRHRMAPMALFGVYAVVSGVSRLLVEEVRINRESLLGLTQPQLWSVLVIAVGIALLVREARGRSGRVTSTSTLDRPLVPAAPERTHR